MEVICSLPFDPQYFRNPVTLIDAGSRVGEFVLPFLKRRHGRAVCIEPYPPSNEELRKKITKHRGIEIVEAALWTQECQVGLAVWKEHTDWNSMFAKPARNYPDETLIVKTIALDDLLILYGWVDLLKMDIEGAEFQVLMESKQLRRVGQITAELHYECEKAAVEIEQLKERLAIQGFEGSTSKGFPHVIMHALNTTIKPCATS